MTSRSLRPARRSSTPLWLLEGLDIVQRRAGLLRAVVAVVCLAGLAASYFAPGIVPPTWLVGAAVALAALLLGLAVAIAADTADLTVRGPRHVRATGRELVAVLPTAAEPADADLLADAVLDARDVGGKLILGLAAAGRDARRTAALTDTLAVALARRDVSVLRLDLASGREQRAGLVEVLRDGHRLADAVVFEPGGLNLARLGPGRDVAGALEVLPELPARLPRDLDVLLVALPTAASRPSVTAAAGLDHVLVVGERDATSRVDLIAGLDSLEAVGIRAQVVLLDDLTAARLVPASATTPTVPDPQVPPDPAVPDPAPDPLVPDPDPDPLVPEPDPLVPDPDPVVPEPEPDPEPEPEPVGSLPETPEPDVTVPEPDVTVPEPDVTVPEPDVTVPEPDVPEPESEATVPGPDVAPASDQTPPARAADPETTTRLRAVQPVHPVDPWAPDDDPLRTTAQLAVLLDDLEAREDG